MPDGAPLLNLFGIVLSGPGAQGFFPPVSFPQVWLTMHLSFLLFSFIIPVLLVPPSPFQCPLPLPLFPFPSSLLFIPLSLYSSSFFLAFSSFPRSPLSVFFNTAGTGLQLPSVPTMRAIEHCCIRDSVDNMAGSLLQGILGQTLAMGQWNPMDCTALAQQGYVDAVCLTLTQGHRSTTPRHC